MNGRKCASSIAWDDAPTGLVVNMIQTFLITDNIIVLHSSATSSTLQSGFLSRDCCIPYGN